MSQKDKEIEIQAIFDSKNHKIKVKLNLTVGELKSLIFTKFQVDTMTYSLLYKKEKLSLSDGRSIIILLEGDRNPLFFVIKKNTITSVPIISNSTKIYTKISTEQFLFTLNEFFKEKHLQFNAKILSQSKGMFEVKFFNSNICRDFVKYFHNHNKVIDTNKKLKENSISYSSYKTNSSRRNLSVSFNDSSNSLRKNILPMLKNKSFNYKYIDDNKYRTYEEQVRLENYLDKSNWINKKGFYSRVGYSVKPKFIGNYVTMTPSLPPILHKYRIVDKDKWITKKGFC